MGRFPNPATIHDCQIDRCPAYVASDRRRTGESDQMWPGQGSYSEKMPRQPHVVDFSSSRTSWSVSMCVLAVHTIPRRPCTRYRARRLDVAEAGLGTAEVTGRCLSFWGAAIFRSCRFSCSPVFVCSYETTLFVVCRGQEASQGECRLVSTLQKPSPGDRTRSTGAAWACWPQPACT